MRNKYVVIATVFCSMQALSAYALDVNIAENIAYITTVHDSKEVVIKRIQDQEHSIPAGYAKTSRKCPPFCIQAMQAAPGVTTVGELEVLDFINNKLNLGVGVMIDARTDSWYKEGTIPGSINVPFTTFSADSSDMVKTAALAKFGVTRKDGGGSLINNVKEFLTGNPDMSKVWDFSRAKELLLWCNGLWCGQSHHAIEGLMALGYPANKIYYYRGGMQAWLSVGLTTVKPGE